MASISSFINKIKTATYGKDVRSALSDGLDAVNKEAESSTVRTKNTENRQNILETKYKEQIANATDITEIKDFHVSGFSGKSYTTMGDRADDLESILEGLAKTTGFPLTPYYPRLTVEVNDDGRVDRATEFIKSIGGGKLIIFEELELKQIKVKEDVLISGASYATKFNQVEDSDVTMVVLESSNVKRGGLENMMLVGNPNSTGGLINFDAPTYQNPAPDYDFPDNTLVLNKLWVRNSQSHGIVLGNNIREGRYTNILIEKCKFSGMNVYNGSDSFFDMITSFWNEQEGFRFAGTSQHKLSNLKAFGNKFYGFNLIESKRLTFTNIEAQENFGDGIYMKSCEDITLLGFLVDSNGFQNGAALVKSGLNIDGSKKIQGIGIATDFHKASGQAGHQTHGMVVNNSQEVNIQLTANYMSVNYWCGNGSTAIVTCNGRTDYMGTGIYISGGKMDLSDTETLNNKNGSQDNLITLTRNYKNRVQLGELYSSKRFTMDIYNTEDDSFLGWVARANLTNGDMSLINDLIQSYGKLLSLGDPANNVELKGLYTLLYGTLYPKGDGELSLGTLANKFKNGYFAGFLTTGSYTTANRPTDSTLQPGACIFDRTLNKPIWRNAANNGWVDGNGNSV